MIRLLRIPGLLLFAATALCVRAEQYLTIPEARKICFPAATEFVEKTHRFSSDEKIQIEKESRTKVRLLGQRFWIAKKESEIIGILVLDFVLGKHEIIDYAVAFNPKGEILQVEILEFRESHGYEIKGPKWREQFKGKDSGSRFRLNDDIYNISGATISCRNVTEGVRRLSATFDLVLRNYLADDGVPEPAQ